MSNQLRIGVYWGTSPVSRLIRFRTWSWASHVSLLTHHGLVIEAVPGVGVVAHDGFEAHHRPGTRVHVYRVGHNPALTHGIVGFALAQVGKGYDWRGVFGFLTRSDVQLREKWFCSELVFAAFRAGGVGLLERVEAHQVAPCDILRSPLLTLERVVVTGEGE